MKTVIARACALSLLILAACASQAAVQDRERGTAAAATAGRDQGFVGTWSGTATADFDDEPVETSLVLSAGREGLTGTLVIIPYIPEPIEVSDLEVNGNRIAFTASYLLPTGQEIPIGFILVRDENRLEGTFSTEVFDGTVKLMRRPAGE